MKIEHMALNVNDVEALVQWYCDTLGFKVARKVDNADNIHFVVDSDGVALIEFYHNQQKPVLDFAAMDVYSFHIAFTSVEGIEADMARLEAAGASPEGEINVTPAGDRLAFFRDPWGIPLQLVERASPIL